MLETVRAFIALNLDVGSIRKVATVQRALRSSTVAPPARASWVSPPNMHITLRFLGDIDASLAPALGDGLREIVASVGPFKLQLPSLDAFPNQHKARVIIAEAQDSTGTLGVLAERVEQLVQSLGFAAERRAFHGHLTLARLKEPADVQAWLASAGTLGIREARPIDCVLYRSELLRSGAEYTALYRVGFAAAAVAAPTAPRSQRPARGPRPSHRPKARPGRSFEEGPGALAQTIPAPPKLPTLPPETTLAAPISAASAPQVLPAEPDASMAEPPMSQPSPGSNARPARSSILPPEVEAALPRDEDWGD